MKTKKNKKRLVVLLVLQLALSYLVGEILVYGFYGKKMVFFPRYMTSWQYHGYTIRGNKPNVSYWHKSPDGRWRFKINSQGFRSEKDYAYQKPEGTLRILTLGDSMTVGYEVDQEETFSVIMEKEFARRGYSTEVINAGVSGFSNAEELIFLKQEGIRYKPDVVILGFSWNDLDDNVRTGFFGLDDQDQLVVKRKTYAPVSKVSDFLNSFFLYRWLSENSYLHSYLNATASRWVKGWMERGRKSEVLSAHAFVSENFLDDYQKKLVCQLVGRMYQTAVKNEALFILVEMPPNIQKSKKPLKLPSWPRDICFPSSVSDIYFNSVDLLKEKAAGQIWYRLNGHGHWTPISHEVVGRHLAALILKHPKIPRASFARKSQK